jgi:hypothetical protein
LAIVDLGTRLGDQDPDLDGQAIGEILDESLAAASAKDGEDSANPDNTGEDEDLTARERLKKGALDGLESGAKESVETSLTYLPKGIAAAVLAGTTYLAAGDKAGEVARALVKFAAAIWPAVL